MMDLKSRWKILKMNWGLSRVVYFPVGSNLLLVVDLSTTNTCPKFAEHFSGRIRFGLIQRTDASRKRRDEVSAETFPLFSYPDPRERDMKTIAEKYNIKGWK
jgi:hypothetical protein